MKSHSTGQPEAGETPPISVPVTRITSAAQLVAKTGVSERRRAGVDRHQRRTSSARIASAIPTAATAPSHLEPGREARQVGNGDRVRRTLLAAVVRARVEEEDDERDAHDHQRRGGDEPPLDAQVETPARKGEDQRREGDEAHRSDHEPDREEPRVVHLAERAQEPQVADGDEIAPGLVPRPPPERDEAGADERQPGEYRHRPPGRVRVEGADGVDENRGGGGDDDRTGTDERESADAHGSRAATAAPTTLLW